MTWAKWPPVDFIWSAAKEGRKYSHIQILVFSYNCYEMIAFVTLSSFSQLLNLKTIPEEPFSLYWHKLVDDVVALNTFSSFSFTNSPPSFHYTSSHVLSLILCVYSQRASLSEFQPVFTCSLRGFKNRTLEEWEKEHGNLYNGRMEVNWWKRSWRECWICFPSFEIWVSKWCPSLGSGAHTVLLLLNSMYRYNFTETNHFSTQVATWYCEPLLFCCNQPSSKGVTSIL